jgi:hypothetical protein
MLESYLAMFGVRFSLSAVKMTGESLICSHMAVVGPIEQNGMDSQVHASYFPEPVLAEAAGSQ